MKALATLLLTIAATSSLADMIAPYKDYHYVGHVISSTEEAIPVGSRFSFDLSLTQNIPERSAPWIVSAPLDEWGLETYEHLYVDWSVFTVNESNGFAPWNTQTFDVFADHISLSGEMTGAFVGFTAYTQPGGLLNFAAFYWGNDTGFTATAVATPDTGNTFALLACGLLSIALLRWRRNVLQR